MKIIWYIIGKYNRWFRKPLVCGTYFENDPKHFINKLTLKEEEESHTNTWAIIILGIMGLKIVKGILTSYYG
ncbi:uncharacterized protein METZ01_LOCUS440121 [marine metagenome]|uniref:Uncharacterized protein n=1 Tax=marine metagenome TaxID=408172 RepID=A0A382YVH7_9ZZZZ